VKSRFHEQTRQFPSTPLSHAPGSFVRQFASR
jgi:hypothetical protein